MVHRLSLSVILWACAPSGCSADVTLTTPDKEEQSDSQTTESEDEGHDGSGNPHPSTGGQYPRWPDQAVQASAPTAELEGCCLRWGDMASDHCVTQSDHGPVSVFLAEPYELDCPTLRHVLTGWQDFLRARNESGRFDELLALSRGARIAVSVQVFRGRPAVRLESYCARSGEYPRSAEQMVPYAMRYHSDCVWTIFYYPREGQFGDMEASAQYFHLSPRAGIVERSRAARR